MSVAFHQGYQLTASDLKIIIRDISGVPEDPYYIRYSIFDYTTGLEVLIGNPDQIPATSGTGQYYANSTIPLDANIGDWVIRWHFMETPTAPLIEVVQEFNVVSSDIKTQIAQTTNQEVMMRRLRIILRDNNPDRNYSVSGDEKIDVKVGNKIYTTSMGALYNIIEDGKNDNL
jgi:hypothetical protein